MAAPVMTVAALGFAVMKGTRHVTRDEVELAASGPVGDREFCLLDADTHRVLRTIEHRSLLAVVATWDGVRLGLTLPGEQPIVGASSPGASVVGEYWERHEPLTLVDGPWARACSDYLGRPVVLARIARPGAVVYGASVSVITTSSLRALGEEGAPADRRRFRATVVVDSGDAPAFVEESWVGRRLAIGDAQVEVCGPIPRCALIDADPESGVAGTRLLRRLGERGPLNFGVDAVVTRPGRVRTGAAVTVADA